MLSLARANSYAAPCDPAAEGQAAPGQAGAPFAEEAAVPQMPPLPPLPPSSGVQMRSAGESGLQRSLVERCGVALGAALSRCN